MDMGDATELSLVGEPKIEAIGELDRQVFEAKRRFLSGHHAQPASHPQVDQNGGLVVEVDNEVLGAPADTLHDAPLDSRQDVFRSIITQDAGEIAEAERVDPLPDEFIEQGAADSLDLGQLWHTRKTDGRHERRDHRKPERTTEPSPDRLERVKA